ncbi:MAG TPA: winged helix DNA-binding protein [Symbiobacteriaceae bacterium]
MTSAEELRYLILAAQREGNRMLTAALRPLGLTPSQAEVLRVLQDHEPLSLVALGDLLVCESGSPSRLVARLIESGLVEQRPSDVDNRKVTLTLTQSGRDVAARIVGVEAELYAAIDTQLEGMPVAELLTALWRFVGGLPAGKALAGRMGRKRPV